MSYTMQLLPDEAELEAIKASLRQLVMDSPNGEHADAAWGILAKIEDKQRQNRANTLSPSGKDRFRP